MLRKVPAVLSLLLLASCAARLPDPRPQPTAPAPTQPSPAPATQAHIPILYVYKTGIRPLAAKTVDALLAAAADSEPARQGHRPWFIAVHQNRGEEDRDGRVGPGEPRFYRVMLYFTPDAQTPRLRTGRYLSLWWWTGKRPDERRYVQVSRPDRPFGERLDVPAVADLPYEVEGSRDPPPGEPGWVEFVDFARPLLEADDGEHDRLPPYLITRSRRTPGVYGLARGTDEGGDAVTGVWTPFGFFKKFLWSWSGSPWGDI